MDLLKNFLKYTIFIFFKPKSFFKKELPFLEWQNIILWIIYLSLIIGSINFLWNDLFPISILKDLSKNDTGNQKKLLIYLSEIMNSFIEAIFIIFILSFLIQKSLNIFGEINKKFKITLNSIAISYIAFFLNIIPYIGNIISLPVFFLFIVVSLKYYHNIRLSIALKVSFFIFLIIFLIFGLSGIVYFQILYNLK